MIELFNHHKYQKNLINFDDRIEDCSGEARTVWLRTLKMTPREECSLWYN